MGLTALLEINTPSGDGDITCAIDPALWASSQAAIQGYAKAAGVTLYYQDVQGAPGTIEANITSLGDAQYQINHAASVAVAAPTGPLKGVGPAAADGASTEDVVVAVVGGLALAALIAWAFLRR